MKGRTKERERKICSNVRASEREGHKGTRAVSKTRKRERKRRRRRFRFRPSGNRTRSLPFLVFDPRQILLPTTPSSRMFSSAPSSYTSSDLTKVSSARLLSRRPYTKCIYVLCKASNRRWPREPDAQCVINTDALVVPFPPSSPPVPFTYSSSQSVPCLCWSSCTSKTYRS